MALALDTPGALILSAAWEITGVFCVKKFLTSMLCLIFVTSEAVFPWSAVQGVYKLLPGVLQPGANMHRQQARLPGWMLLS